VAIKAERDGTVKELKVASGTRVNTRDLLVVFA
jgi:biotin carboxyl carrier protein